MIARKSFSGLASSAKTGQRYLTGKSDDLRSTTRRVPSCDSKGYTSSSGWPSRSRWLVLPPFSYIAPIMSKRKSLSMGNVPVSSGRKAGEKRTRPRGQPGRARPNSKGKSVALRRRERLDREDLVPVRPDEAAHDLAAAELNRVHTADARPDIEAGRVG